MLPTEEPTNKVPFEKEILRYSYDLLYDIKNREQLQKEVEYLSTRLAGIADLCREDGYSIDSFIKEILNNVL